jgi:hypothetical protein
VGKRIAESLLEADQVQCMELTVRLASRRLQVNHPPAEAYPRDDYDVDRCEMLGSHEWAMHRRKGARQPRLNGS